MTSRGLRHVANCRALSVVWLDKTRITDDAINGSGLCVRDLEIAVDGKVTDAQPWVANGFVFVDNRIRQRYIVQLIQSGDENRVVQVELDQNNSGQITVERPEDFDRTVLAVQSLAPRTRQPAGARAEHRVRV